MKKKVMMKMMMKAEVRKKKHQTTKLKTLQVINLMFQVMISTKKTVRKRKKCLRLKASHYFNVKKIQFKKKKR